MKRYFLRSMPCLNSSQRKTPFNSFLKILHELVHAVALSSAAWNGGDFGPEDPLLSLMHHNFDLHYRSPHADLRADRRQIQDIAGRHAISSACAFTSADT